MVLMSTTYALFIYIDEYSRLHQLQYAYAPNINTYSTKVRLTQIPSSNSNNTTLLMTTDDSYYIFTMRGSAPHTYPLRNAMLSYNG